MKKNLLQLTEHYISMQGEGLKTGRPSHFVRFSPCNLSCANCDTKFSAYEIKEDEQIYWTPKELLHHMHEVELERVKRPMEFGKDKRWYPNDVIMTGGEPLIQDHGLLTELCDRLKTEGRQITFETNCTVTPGPSLISRVDFWSVSPKPETTAFKTPPPGCAGGKVRFMDGVFKDFCRLMDVGKENVQMKFVINCMEDLAWLRETLKRFPEMQSFNVPLVLQPDNQVDTLEAYLKRATWLTSLILTDASWGVYNVRVIMQTHRILWGQQRGV